MYLFEHSRGGIRLINKNIDTKAFSSAHFGGSKIIQLPRQGVNKGSSVAVLLDAENLPGSYGVGAIGKAQMIGPVHRVMAFADWDVRTSKHRGSWRDIVNRFPIQAIQVDRCPGKKMPLIFLLR